MINFSAIAFAVEKLVPSENTSACQHSSIGDVLQGGALRMRDADIDRRTGPNKDNGQGKGGEHCKIAGLVVGKIEARLQKT
ncbi:hypothetical protein LP421_24190 [Rhizobium sp. RCAM05350]|nr:hypothetical protein LP421_24190 [Rhizobium sp. RCAM05350]